MHFGLQDIASFILVTVALKMVIAGAIGDVLRRSFKRWLIRTERDLVVWLHYRKKAEKAGHRHKTVMECPEDACAKVTK